MSSASSKRAPFARVFAIQLLIAVLLLLLIEGIASFRAAWRKINWEAQADLRPTAESVHTDYDPLLGWISRPGHYPDLYGEDRDLTIKTNRTRLTPSPDPVEPTVQLVASGDSFTMGYGVGDENTYLSNMEKLHPEINALNIALGGYGLDQAFLRYQRDGVHLPHQVHLFAFITEDYHRMGRARFMGYAKPTLALRDGKLMAENVPVPRERHSPLFQMRFGEAIRHLNITRWLTEGATRRAETETAAFQQNAQQLATAVFHELHALHRAHGRTGVLVHLPMEEDHARGGSNGWRAWLRKEAEQNGWLFVDLVRPFRTIPRDQVKSMFIQDDAERFRGARGHYTEHGNALIARALLDELIRIGVLTPPPSS